MMRFYDVTSSIDRRRALDDLIGKNDKNHHPNNYNNYNYNTSNLKNENNVKNIWMKLPNEWRHDKEFVLTVLRVTAPAAAAAAAAVVISSSGDNEENDDESSDEEEDDEEDNNESNVSSSTISVPSLPSKSEFERLFPQSLRFDRDVVLAWARRSDFPKLYNSRHLFLPPCLSNDKEVCLEYCRQIPRSLQDCHVDLCDDIELVTAAIERFGGLELQYASYRLQCEESIVRKACSSDGKALSFCSPICDAFINITSDRNFMLNVVLGSDDDRDGDGRGGKTKRRRGRSSSGSSGTMWRLLDKAIKETDEELALQALRNGLALRDIPKQFVDVAFLKRALTNNSVPLYLELSQKYQSIDELGLEAITAYDSTPDVHSKAFELNDDDSVYLRDNRDVVLAVCQRGSVELLRELLGQPVEIPIVNGDNAIQPNLNQFLQLMRVAMPDRNNNANANINANVNRNNNNANNGINDANANMNANANNGDNIANNDGNDANNIVRFDINNPNNDVDDDDEDDDNFALGYHFNDRMNLNLMNLIIPPQRPLMVNPRRRQPPSRFLDDYDIMKVAVSKDPMIFGNASMRLRENIDIILASIADGPSAWIRLKNISWDVQRQNPAITIRCLNFMESKNLRYLPNYVPDDVWTANRDLRVAWIRRKGNILQCFHPGITTDETLALEVAKHTWTQLHKVGEAFLTDKQFVMKALELDGRCIKHVPAELITEFDVLTVAAANYYTRYDYEIAAAAAVKKKKRAQDDSSSTDSSTDEMLTIASMGRAFPFLDIYQLKAKIIRKLELHDTFVLEFLRGIAIDSSSSPSPRRGPRGPPALRSQLTMLDRGVETSEAFKRLIAEYLAVPLGKELTSLRSALVNIKRPAPNGDANDHANSQATIPPLFNRFNRRRAPMPARENAAVHLPPRQFQLPLRNDDNGNNNGDQQAAPRLTGPQQRELEAQAQERQGRRIRPLRRAREILLRRLGQFDAVEAEEAQPEAERPVQQQQPPRVAAAGNPLGGFGRLMRVRVGERPVAPPRPRPRPQQPLMQQQIGFAVRPVQRQPRQRDNNEGVVDMMAQDLRRIRAGEIVDDINLFFD